MKTYVRLKRNGQRLSARASGGTRRAGAPRCVSLEMDHVGIDIRTVMRGQRGTMFGNSLTGANKSHTFHAPTRPRSRANDISFEAEMERETRLQAAHGRRAAAVAAANATGPPALPPRPNIPSKAATLPAGQGQSSFAATFAHKRDSSMPPPPLPPQPPPALPSQQDPARGSSRNRPLSSTMPLPKASDGNPLDQGLFSVRPMALGPMTINARSTPSNGTIGGQPSPSPAASRVAGASLASSRGSLPAASAGSPQASRRGGASGQSGSSSSPHGAHAGAASEAPAGGPTRIVRAREWSIDVENAYRLQEAGYRDEREALELGHPPVEYWPVPAAAAAAAANGGAVGAAPGQPLPGQPPIGQPPRAQALIRKLVTRDSLGKETRSQLYFSKGRECEDKDIPKVKLFSYNE